MWSGQSNILEKENVISMDHCHNFSLNSQRSAQQRLKKIYQTEHSLTCQKSVPLSRHFLS